MNNACLVLHADFTMHRPWCCTWTLAHAFVREGNMQTQSVHATGPGISTYQYRALLMARQLIVMQFLSHEIDIMSERLLHYLLFRKALICGRWVFFVKDQKEIGLKLRAVISRFVLSLCWFWLLKVLSASILYSRVLSWKLFHWSNYTEFTLVLWSLTLKVKQRPYWMNEGAPAFVFQLQPQNAWRKNGKSVRVLRVRRMQTRKRRRRKRSLNVQITLCQFPSLTHRYLVILF